MRGFLFGFIVILPFLWLADFVEFLEIVDFVGFAFLRGDFASGGFLISTPFRFWHTIFDIALFYVVCGFCFYRLFIFFGIILRFFSNFSNTKS